MAVAVAAVFVLVFAVDGLTSTGRIHPGVTVAGVKIGGMTPAKAAAVLHSKLPEKAKSPVVVAYKGQTWPVSSDDLGISFDYPALAAEAMRVGRSSGVFGNMAQRVRAWFVPVVLPSPASAEQAKLDSVLGDITSAIDQPPKDATVVLKGSSWGIKPSRSGLMVDHEKLSQDLLRAFTAADRQVTPVVGVAQADISDQAAESARTVAEAMTAQPATVTWGATTWRISPTELQSMIAFRKVASSSGASPTLEPYVLTSEASKTIAPRLGNNVGHPARDASFTTNNGVVSIVPAQVGVGPDIESLSANLTTVLKGAAGQPRVVALHTRKTMPKLTTDMARAMNIQDRISRFTTTYTPSNRPRVNNIHTLGDALNGKLIAPDATFSFNGTVGERTAAKGYEEANAIVDGKLVPQLGGGICQVGTTLFNTVFFSGLPILERHNHSFYISHYPKGRDATVSWGGPDLKFKNTTGHWLLLSVSYTSSSITMSLYGADPGYTVAYVTGPFTNEKPFKTETVKDPKMKEGKQVVDDPGENGVTCVVTRTVTKGGAPVSTDVFRSVYKPKVEVLRVGTKATGSTGSTTATDTTGTIN